jgi:prevent-host-death family protein
MNNKQYSLTQLADRFPDLISLVETGQAVELTRQGRVIAVLVSPQDYQQFQPRPLSPPRTVWQAIQAFRQRLDPADLEPDEDFCQNLRDRSPGREVSW